MQNNNDKILWKPRAKKGSVVESFSIRHDIVEPKEQDGIRTQTELNRRRKQESSIVFNKQFDEYFKKQQ